MCVVKSITLFTLVCVKCESDTSAPAMEEIKRKANTCHTIGRQLRRCRAELGPPGPPPGACVGVGSDAGPSARQAPSKDS